jgi:PIN domain nuclease of toxin-antitoxin system
MGAQLGRIVTAVSDETYLLDTCAVLYAAKMEPIKATTLRALEMASLRNAVVVSPVTAWELGMLTAGRRVNLTTDPLKFFRDFTERPGLSLCDLSPDILIKASFLPGLRHKDPADRLLIATARHYHYTLVTSDRAILAYGAEGHVKTLAC